MDAVTQAAMILLTCETCGTGPDYVPPVDGDTSRCPDCGSLVLLKPDPATCSCEFCQEWPLAKPERLIRERRAAAG